VIHVVNRTPALVRYGIPVFLVVVVIVLYGGVAGARLQYSWDDNRYIYENPYIRDLSLQGVANIFTHSYFGAYIPVTMLGYTIQYQLWNVSPAGYFIVNMLLHALNTVLVYWLLLRLTGNRAVAVIAALLFAAHPINVESVAWVSQLKSVLSMFFFLLAWLTHMDANERRGGWRWLLLSYLFFALCILAKPTAVGAVLLFMLYDHWASEMPLPNLIVRNFVYGLIGIAGAVLIIVTHREVGGIKEAFGANVFENLALILRVTWDYVVSLVNPATLNNMYIYTMPQILSEPLSILGGALVLIMLLVFAVWQPLGKPFCAFAVAWVAVLILPTYNIVPIAIQRADRYLYYPSVMIFMVVAMAALLLWERFRSVNQRYLLSGAGLAILAVLGVMTTQRVAVWQSTQTLWQDHLKAYPNSATGLLNLGVGYYNDNQAQDAFNTLTRLVELYPDHYRGNRLLGLTYLRAQNYPGAITYLQRALEIGGTPDDIRDDLGTAYFQEGLRQFERGEYTAALALYSQAVPLVAPENVPVILNNAGFTLQKAGRLPEAVQAFDAAIQLNPSYVRAYINKGDTLLMQENYAGARDAYQQALALGAQPDAATQSNTCLAKAEAGDPPADTLPFCQGAINAEPQNTLYLGRTAHVLLLYNENAAAQEYAQRSLQIQPTSLGYRTLGDALARQGQTAQAVDAYRQALSLDPGNVKAQQGLTAMGAAP
jgi:tetratricopeptide (TPR) repeat protein